MIVYCHHRQKNSIHEYRFRTVHSATTREKTMPADTPNPPMPGCFDCATNATARLDETFVGMVQAKRLALGQRPAERAVFRKLHGAAAGRLEMRPDLPANLKIGVFAKT